MYGCKRRLLGCRGRDCDKESLTPIAPDGTDSGIDCGGASGNRGSRVNAYCYHQGDSTKKDLSLSCPHTVLVAVFPCTDDGAYSRHNVHHSYRHGYHRKEG